MYISTWLCVLSITLMHGVASMSSIPSETIVEHLIPVMDDPTIAQLGRTHSKFHQLLNGELCQRAPYRLQQIVEHASSMIESVHDAGDYGYDLELDDGLHSYFMHRNVSELLFYLTLFVMDRSMSFRLLLRLRTVYSVNNVMIESVDSNYNISSKANKIRDWMLNNNCTDMRLSTQFKNIRDRKQWSYTRVVAQWLGVQEIIKRLHDEHSVQTLQYLWNDMLFVLKKDIVKLLMRSKGSHAIFFSNHNWLQIIHIISTKTLPIMPQESVLLMERLKSFEQAVIALFTQIGKDNEVQMSSNVSDARLIPFNLVFADLSAITKDVFDDVVDCVSRMEDESVRGLFNSEYEDCVDLLWEMRMIVLRYIGRYETVFGAFQEEQARQLLNELDRFTARVVALLYSQP